MMEIPMVKMTDIHTLTAFLHDHKLHLERLAITGRPEVLTVNGKARVVVQGAEAYQKMVEAFEAAETERVLRERLAELDRGEPGVAAEEVLAEIRNRLNAKRK